MHALLQGAHVCPELPDSRILLGLDRLLPLAQSLELLSERLETFTFRSQIDQPEDLLIYNLRTRLCEFQVFQRIACLLLRFSDKRVLPGQKGNEDAGHLPAGVLLLPLRVSLPRVWMNVRGLL